MRLRARFARMAAYTLCMVCTAYVYAEDPPKEGEGGAAEGEGAAPVSSAIYIPLKPSFVVNYGGGGRLRYLKTDIAVRLTNASTAHAIQHHMPYIRNNLVMLFAAQNEETIASQEGKEALRKDALEVVRALMVEEEGIEDGVQDLFFNNLVVQR